MYYVLSLTIWNSHIIIILILPRIVVGNKNYYYTVANKLLLLKLFQINCKSNYNYNLIHFYNLIDSKKLRSYKQRHLNSKLKIKQINAIHLKTTFFKYRSNSESFTYLIIKHIYYKWKTYMFSLDCTEHKPPLQTYAHSITCTDCTHKYLTKMTHTRTLKLDFV